MFVSGLSFSCVGVGLPKTEANWEDVLADLNIIKSDIQVSTHFLFFFSFCLKFIFDIFYLYSNFYSENFIHEYRKI